MLVLPRIGARLSKSTVYLSLVLRNTAGVDSTVRRTVDLHAAVIGAAIGLLRPCLTLCWPGSLLLMHLRCGLRLLMLLRRLCLLMLLSRLRLLMLLRLFRLVLVITLLIVLGIGNGCGSEEQKQNRCDDQAVSFHLVVLLLNFLGVHRPRAAVGSLSYRGSFSLSHNTSAESLQWAERSA